MSPFSTPPAPAQRFEDDRLDALVVNLQRHGLDEPDADLREAMLALVERAENLVDSSARRDLALEIRRLCFLRNLPAVLALSGVPLVYNFGKEYTENRPAPWDRVPDRHGVTRGRRWSLMGLEVGFPVGIPASVLTANSRWIDYYSRNGFNIITYKTVRSAHRGALEYPNWVYLEGLDRPVPVDAAFPEQVIGDRETFFANPAAFSTANSFGVPSEAPEVWMRDVAQTLNNLKAGKLLIVSVMGTPVDDENEPRAEELLVRDYAHVAELAREAGAQAVELNLSCPNTLKPGGGMKPPVCDDHELSARIVHCVADRLEHHGTRIVCKLSWMPQDDLARLLPRLARRVHGVSGINTMPARVLDHRGQQTFPGRDVAGVSGVAIREFGLDFVRSIDALRTAHDWEFAIIGMGGVMSATDVRIMLEAGADAVQTATAASHSPTLPLELLRQPEGALSATARVVLNALPPNKAPPDLVDLATETEMAISAVRAGLLELERHGIVAEKGDADHASFALQQTT